MDGAHGTLYVMGSLCQESFERALAVRPPVGDSNLMNEQSTGPGTNGTGSARVPMFNVPASVLATAALLILVHFVRTLLPPEESIAVLLTLAFIPARYLASAPALPGGTIADFTSFVTYMLVHANYMHLLVNLFWMLAFGSAIAKRLGGRGFFGFSVFCGVAAAATHLALHFGEMIPVVGASGAISGQMAGAIRFLFGPRSPTSGGRIDVQNQPLTPIWQTLKDGRILLFLAIWAGLNLMFGLGYVSIEGAGEDIAWEAHLGGFLAGLLSFDFFDRMYARSRPVD